MLHVNLASFDLSPIAIALFHDSISIHKSVKAKIFLGQPSSYDVFAMTKLANLVDTQQLGAGVRKEMNPPDPYFSAFKFRKALDRIDIQSSQSKFRLLSAALKRSTGFVFVASLKQHKKNRGIIVNVAPNASVGQLSGYGTMAIVSDAKKQTIELNYGLGGEKHSVVFKAKDKTKPSTSKMWKKVVLEVDDDVITLYVDCRKIATKILKSRFYKFFNANCSKLTLATGDASLDGYSFDGIKVIC